MTYFSIIGDGKKLVKQNCDIHNLSINIFLWDLIVMLYGALYSESQSENCEPFVTDLKSR